MAPYRVDGADAVIRLPDTPAIDVGAPLPQVFAAEHQLELSYYIAKHTSRPYPVALIKFGRPLAHFFGPPTEDNLQGHPLHERGLDWYAGQEVRDSSWIRLLSADTFLFRHFIFTFHDSTFECVAASYQVEVKDDET